MTQVYVRHVRAAGICCRGARAWFARQEGLSWQTFLAEGYPADTLRACGCAICDRVIAAAEAEDG